MTNQPQCAAALHLTVEKWYKAVRQEFPGHRADINVETGDEKTALYLAVEYWRGLKKDLGQSAKLSIVELLLGKGAKIGARVGGKTVLHLMAEVEHLGIMKILLEYSDLVDIDAKTDDGKTALHIATKTGYYFTVQELLEKLANHRADINTKDNDGETALYLAAKGWNLEVVDLLSKKGSDINVEDNDGKTALHLAAEGGQEAVVELLLKKGAVNAGDNGGRTALDLAVDNGHEDVARLLQPSTDTEVSAMRGYHLVNFLGCTISGTLGASLLLVAFLSFL